MLTKEDLNAIGELIDTKIHTTLRKELMPIHKKLNKLQNDLVSTIRFFDEGHIDHEKRIVQLEIPCAR